MEQEFQADIDRVGRIAAVPTILEMVCQSTGMRFAAVARVTEGRWIACSVLDEIEFGLRPGGELKVETTLCREIRQSREPIVIDHVAEDETYCQHGTPAMYGFQSYISVPIILGDGSFFGTLCAIDPRPARLKTPETIGMFRLFAELIAKQLDAGRKLVEVESALVESERSNETLQRFASIASHDLREPLRQVSVFAKLLLDHYQGKIDAEARKYFDFIESGAARMGRLLDGLMAYSQIDEIRAVSFEEADAEAALNDALEGLKLVLEESDAVVTRGTLPVVKGNATQLARVFQNLIGNAVKYRSEAAPRIHVAAERRANEWVFSVSDNGIGIAPLHRTKIFEVFARLHGAEIAGAGLGLAFCRRIVELHHGRIWVGANPEYASGSVFYFALPV